MVLYVQENGAVVRRSGDGIEVRKQGQLLYRIPLIGVERVVILGYVQVTTQALHALSTQGIDVVYLTRNGRMKCTVTNPKRANEVHRN